MTKGLKTFNLYHSTIDIVKQKPNQSAFVDRAIRKLHEKQSEFRAIDLPDMTLVGVLQQRYHDDPKLGGLLSTLRTLLVEKS